MSRLRWLAVLLGLGAGLLACSPIGERPPLRSPTRDYPHPPSTTSDGRVLGTDDEDPTDSLERDLGWEMDEDGVRHDPGGRGGGYTDEEARERMPSSAGPR